MSKEWKTCQKKKEKKKDVFDLIFVFICFICFYISFMYNNFTYPQAMHKYFVIQILFLKHE